MDIGSNLEIGLANAQEPMIDVDATFGIVNRLEVWSGDGKFYRARACAGVDQGDCVGLSGAILDDLTRQENWKHHHDAKEAGGHKPSQVLYLDRMLELEHTAYAH